MEATLEVVKREGRGKNEANRLRAAGKIPAVVYGSTKKGEAPAGTSVAVDPKALLRILHSDSGANTLITLKSDGQDARVMVKEYQLDPITHQLLHADFYQLALDKAISVKVPVLIKGEPRGVKLQGGLLDFVTREIEIECLPTEIPEHIDVDVTELMLNQSIRVRDLAPGKWKALSDAETMIVHVVMPKAEESATAAAAEGAAPAAAAAEPEVIKKGKEDKEEKK